VATGLVRIVVVVLVIVVGTVVVVVVVVGSVLVVGVVGSGVSGVDFDTFEPELLEVYTSTSQRLM